MVNYKNKLSSDQISKAEKLGEMIGGRKRLINLIQSSNGYLQKHIKIALPLVVLLTLGVVVYTFIKMSSTQVGNKVNIIRPDIEHLQLDSATIKYNQQVQDIAVIQDSIQRLLLRGNLSFEDSLYISWGLTFLDNIDNR